MSELVDELRKVQRLGGDTYSSAEVVGLIEQAADEIVRLQWALRWGDDRAYREGRLVMDSKQDLVDEIERLRAALQKIADLIDSDAWEPLDDAINIANKALIAAECL